MLLHAATSCLAGLDLLFQPRDGAKLTPVLQSASVMSSTRRTAACRSPVESQNRFVGDGNTVGSRLVRQSTNYGIATSDDYRPI